MQWIIGKFFKEFSFPKSFFSGIPLGVNATRLQFTRDYFYQFADVTFSISCQVNLCPMGEKDSACYEEVDTDAECMKLE